MEEAKKDEVTTHDIMDFLVEHMATKVDLRDLEERMTQRMATEIKKSEQETRDFIGDQVQGLRGDVVLLMRKEDGKVVKLIEMLKNKRILDVEEEKMLLSMEPFAKLYL